tara:strand:+ start:163 stop:432 length:270 start_codon:yes stop_codon:yes gene_type:complete
LLTGFNDYCDYSLLAIRVLPWSCAILNDYFTLRDLRCFYALAINCAKNSFQEICKFCFAVLLKCFVVLQRWVKIEEYRINPLNGRISFR